MSKAQILLVTLRTPGTDMQIKLEPDSLWCHFRSSINSESLHYYCFRCICSVCKCRAFCQGFHS